MANVKLSLLIAALCGLSLIAPVWAQQSQSGTTQNATGTGATSTSGAVSTTSSATTSTTSTSLSGSRSLRSILLPTGRIVSPSNSTVFVCDDPGAPYPDEVDVCSTR
jgi:hypothetical protein